MSLRFRLILSFILVVLVSVVLVIVIARQGAAREVRAFMFQGGMNNSPGVLRAFRQYYLSNNTWAGVETLFSSTGTGIRPGIRSMIGMMNQRIRLADAEGNLIADSANPNASGMLGDAEKLTAISIEVGGSTVGYLILESGMRFTQAEEKFLVNRLNRAAWLAAIISGSLSIGLAFYLAYRLLRPVQDLTVAAERLAQGDLSQRVQIHSEDELAHLGKTFNRMADSLQLAEEARKVMTADVAHELRNPLAVQRANLEALQDGVYPLKPENLQPVLEQNLLLTHLVEDLRTLALADAGQITLERIEVDIPALVSRVIERFEPQVAAHQVKMEYQPNPTALLISYAYVDPMRIEQILNNLLSNALRYTPKEGRIWINLDCTPARMQLEVLDSGPGIPPEALPHIFERFYRADRSRNRSEGGSGLGLAIARQLAEAHGGTLTAANHPQGGALFTLVIPSHHI